MPRTHVIGAGLAGLATAVSLVRRGRDVTLYEAGGHAGGRCRSFADAKLDRTIDNGNHLLLSGNHAAMRYLADIEAADSLIGPASACFPFLDLRTGQRWLLRPSAGRVPWWILNAGRRVPDTRAWHYFSALRFVTAGAEATVTDCVGETGVLFERFWKPLAVGALNTPARSGAARLLWAVLRETFARGEAACRPRIAKTGLSAAFVDPALRFLRQRGATVRFGRRLRRISYTSRRAAGLDFGSEKIRLRDGGAVVLAVPRAGCGGAGAGFVGPRRYPRYRQRSFPVVRTGRNAAGTSSPRTDRGNRTVALRSWRRRFHHRQRSGRTGRRAGGDHRPPELGRRCGGAGPGTGEDAAVSRRQGKARHVRADARPGEAPSPDPNRVRQPVSGWGLDRYGSAGNHRERRSVRSDGGSRHSRVRTGARRADIAGSRVRTDSRAVDQCPERKS